LRGAFVLSEIEQCEGRFHITNDGDTIAGGKTFEKCAGGVEMYVLEEIDGWTRFDEKQNLCRIVHGSEFGDALFDAVIKDVEVFATQTFNEFAAGVGYNDADIDAIDGEANGLRRVGRWFLRAEGKDEEQKEQGSKGEAKASSGKEFVCEMRVKGRSESWGLGSWGAAVVRRSGRLVSQATRQNELRGRLSMMHQTRNEDAGKTRWD